MNGAGRYSTNAPVGIVIIGLSLLGSFRQNAGRHIVGRSMRPGVRKQKVQEVQKKDGMADAA